MIPGGSPVPGNKRGGQVLDDIANFFIKNAAKTKARYMIWRQKIKNPAGSGTWRTMGDRGGSTANHMDHIHLDFHGNARRDGAPRVGNNVNWDKGDDIDVALDPGKKKEEKKDEKFSGTVISKLAEGVFSSVGKLFGNAEGGYVGVPKLATGAYINYDGTLANLHKGEAVLTKPLTRELHEGIKNINHNNSPSYNVNVNVAGTNASADEIETAVWKAIDRKEMKMGRSRSVIQ